MPDLERRPVLYVFFGLIASGKSTLASAWAGRHGLAYHNSDRVRKELAGLAPETPQREAVDGGIYTAEFSRRTYDRLLELAAALLAAGRSVVLDGSYQARAERDRLRLLAAGHGADLRFVLCRCEEEIMRRRMEERLRDPQAVSDGRWEVYLLQRQRFEPPTELEAAEVLELDTAAPIGELLEKLDRRFAGRQS